MLGLMIPMIKAVPTSIAPTGQPAKQKPLLKVVELGGDVSDEEMSDEEMRRRGGGEVISTGVCEQKQTFLCVGEIWEFWKFKNLGSIRSL